MKRFRPATEKDVDIIIEMMRRYYAEDGYRFDEDEARQAIIDLVRNTYLGRLWLAHDQGDVVGYLVVTLGFSFEYRGRDAFIDELFILEDYRGQGLGREALGVVEDYCRAMGVKAIHLEVERHRKTALELYRGIGFENHDRELMSKWLS